MQLAKYADEGVKIETQSSGGRREWGSQLSETSRKLIRIGEGFRRVFRAIRVPLSGL